MELNRPFAGALVPRAYYGVDARVSAIMIEVNRGLYLDEGTGAPSAGDICRKKLAMVSPALIEGSV